MSLDDSASINMDVTVALSHAIFGFMCSFAKNFQATGVNLGCYDELVKKAIPRGG